MNNLIVPKSIDEMISNVLGPTTKEIGKDLQTLYLKGRDLIVTKAFKKVTNPGDGKTANLRVARDVFWNGSFSDEDICAEYFGGILASSRSIDGKDDIGVFFVDIIKSLSSSQLKLHYIIYRSLNKLFINDDKKSTLNPGKETELSREDIFISSLQLLSEVKETSLGPALFGLHAKGLVGDFESQSQELEDGKILPYLKCAPTSLGVQLFSIANNKFENWRNFATKDFGDFENIQLPKITTKSLEELLDKEGVKKKK